MENTKKEIKENVCLLYASIFLRGLYGLIKSLAWSSAESIAEPGEQQGVAERGPRRTQDGVREARRARRRDKRVNRRTRISISPAQQASAYDRAYGAARVASNHLSCVGQEIEHLNPYWSPGIDVSTRVHQRNGLL